MIVNLDGDPIWSPIKDNDLKYAVNTNWDLFQHVPSNTYYLRNNDTWLKTADVMKGPWAPAGTLPASFKNLPPDDNWKDVQGGPAGQSRRGVGRAEGVHQQSPGGADSADRRAEVPPGHRARACSG